jgi:hypothetical protein
VNLREQFLPLLGDWAGVEHEAASPDGLTRHSRAMLIFKLIAQDRMVVQDYRQLSDDGRERTGHGVFRVEPETGEVQWWYFDAAGGSPGPAQGWWRRGRLTLERETSRGLVRHRFTCEDDWLLCTVDRRAEDDEEDWQELLSGRYQRISSH